MTGPAEITETLLAEGLSLPAIEHGLRTLSTATDIRSPLNFVRSLATNDFKPEARPLGCSACRDGFLLNEDTGDVFFPPEEWPGPGRNGSEFVRPCNTCRPKKGIS